MSIKQEISGTTEASHAIPLYLLTGFLGSGKTSCLNHILSQYSGKNVGLIINEFGSIGVDSAFLPNDENIHKTELNGGQIFCSCLSGTFVDSIVAFEKTPIEALFVEASGLAKPAPLMEIISWAENKSQNAFSYKGMLCIIDAEKFLPLSSVLLTLEEQVLYSDRFLLNKCDLVAEETLQDIELYIQKLRPGAWIRRTTYGNMPLDFLPHTFEKDALRGINPAKYQGWGEPGRPLTLFLKPAKPVTEESLLEFLEKAAPETYRLKGFAEVIYSETTRAVKTHLKAESNTTYTVTIDCVGDKIRVSPTAISQEQTLQKGFVLITPGNSSLKNTVFSLWKQITGSGAFIS